MTSRTGAASAYKRSAVFTLSKLPIAALGELNERKDALLFFVGTLRPVGLATRAMGIILFLVDTSASMNQRTFLGTSYLDVAKGAIDTFMKVRIKHHCMRACGSAEVSHTPARAFFRHRMYLRDQNVFYSAFCVFNLSYSIVRGIRRVEEIDICSYHSMNLRMQ